MSKKEVIIDGIIFGLAGSAAMFLFLVLFVSLLNVIGVAEVNIWWGSDGYTPE